MRFYYTGRRTGAETAAQREFRVTEKEPVTPVGFRVIAVQVELCVVVDIDPGIDEQEDILGLRATPGLGERLVVERGVRANLHTVIDQRLCIGTLVAARQRIIIGVFHARVDETVVAQGEADIAFHLVTLFVLVKFAVPDPQRTAFRGILHLEVDDPGDGVGAVLGGRAVPQDFDVLDGDTRDHAYIGTVRAFPGAGGELGNQRRPVAAFAVHQDQGLVRGKAAHRDRPHEGILVS